MGTSICGDGGMRVYGYGGGVVVGWARWVRQVGSRGEEASRGHALRAQREWGAHLSAGAVGHRKRRQSSSFVWGESTVGAVAAGVVGHVRWRGVGGSWRGCCEELVWC